MIKRRSRSSSVGRTASERWAEDVQHAYWRTLTLEQKLAIVDGICRSVDEVSRAGLRLRHPDADDEELELRAACMRIGRQAVEAVLGRPLTFG